MFDGDAETDVPPERHEPPVLTPTCHPDHVYGPFASAGGDASSARAGPDTSTKANAQSAESKLQFMPLPPAIISKG